MLEERTLFWTNSDLFISLQWLWKKNRKFPINISKKMKDIMWLEHLTNDLCRLFIFTEFFHFSYWNNTKRKSLQFFLCYFCLKIPTKIFHVEPFLGRAPWLSFVFKQMKLRSYVKQKICNIKNLELQYQYKNKYNQNLSYF